VDTIAEIHNLEPVILNLFDPTLYLYMPLSKLAYFRKTKGLSQEQLATLSGVSARTIQRIEQGKVEAHPATLKMLADCLEVSADLLLEPVSGPVNKTPLNKNLLILFPASALIGLFFPILNVLLPALLWWAKKDEAPQYDDAGRQIINFQLSMSFAFVPAVVLLIFYFPLGFPLVLLIYFYNLGLCLINLFRAINQQPSKYPLSYAFLERNPDSGR
jgi:transcriptional regulator with XRE-family HTH domain